MAILSVRILSHSSNVSVGVLTLTVSSSQIPWVDFQKRTLVVGRSKRQKQALVA
jgi:hypothetical protein